MFRGREQSRPELGIKLLGRLAEDVAEIGFVEAAPKQDGRNMLMVLAPLRKKSERKEAREHSCTPTKLPFRRKRTERKDYAEAKDT